MKEVSGIYEDRVFITYKGETKETVNLPVVSEMPMTIIFNDEELATLVCSPYEFELLAVGFLVREGLLCSRGDILDI